MRNYDEFMRKLKDKANQASPAQQQAAAIQRGELYAPDNLVVCVFQDEHGPNELHGLDPIPLTKNVDPYWTLGEYNRWFALERLENQIKRMINAQ